MSAVSIDTERARSAASGLNMLAWNPQDNATAVSNIAALGDFVAEAAPTVTLLNELDAEIRLLADVFTTRADLAISVDDFPSREAYLAAMNAATEAFTAATNTLLGSLGNTINAATTGAAFVAAVGEDVVTEVFEFLAGDVANFWHGGDDESFPWGQLGAAGLKTSRIFQWAYRGGPVPVFNTGRVGSATAGLLSRFPSTTLAGRGGAFLSNASRATPIFTKVGIFAGLTGTALGAYNLYQQGNPITAFQEEGAGYIADVSSTVFSASSTALLIAGPAAAPVLVPIVVGAAVIWAGAEVWDRWGDDISEWAGEEWDEFVADLDVAWDATTAAAGAAVDWTGDRLEDGAELLADAGGAIVDAGGEVIEFGGDVLDAGGELLSLGGDAIGALDPRSWF